MGTARALAFCSALLLTALAPASQAQPSAAQPAAGQPAASHPGAAQPAAAQPAARQPAAGQPRAAQPAAGPSRAADPAAVDAAIELANRGYELFMAGDYDEAIALFEQAEKLSHSPVILSFIAQSHEALGRLIEAKAQYDQIVGEQLGAAAPEDFRNAQQRARRLLPQLIRRIPKVQLRLSGITVEEVRVELDGLPLTKTQLFVPVAVNPGQHRMVIYPPGLPPVVRTFTAIERQVSDVDLVFGTRDVTTVVRERYRDISWLPPSLAFAIGFAASNVSVISAAVYFTRAEDLKAQCPNDRCAPELESERDTISSIGDVSMAAFGVALAGAAAGGVLMFFVGNDDDKDDGDGSVRAGIGPGGLLIEGHF